MQSPRIPRTPNRKQVTVGGCIGIFMLIIILIGVSLLANGFLVMIAAGLLGHVFGAAWLFISYGQSILVALALSLLAGICRAR